ncbi:hypothetical protein KSS87_011326 [Heliosperma pusillum]|nr:hypothetical protein KSS87_023326 [Heliosperma pusillum]KAH9625308.1 hypothetical protein KSS87_011326 [Heliosperma pusillum]
MSSLASTYDNNLVQCSSSPSSSSEGINTRFTFLARGYMLEWLVLLATPLDVWSAESIAGRGEPLFWANVRGPGPDPLIQSSASSSKFAASFGREVVDMVIKPEDETTWIAHEIQTYLLQLKMKQILKAPDCESRTSAIWDQLLHLREGDGRGGGGSVWGKEEERGGVRTWE